MCKAQAPDISFNCGMNREWRAWQITELEGHILKSYDITKELSGKFLDFK